MPRISLMRLVLMVPSRVLGTWEWGQEDRELKVILSHIASSWPSCYMRLQNKIKCLVGTGVENTLLPVSMRKGGVCPLSVGTKAPSWGHP